MGFSITSVMFLDRHDPNDDRNMREIRSLNRFSSILVSSKRENMEKAKGRGDVLKVVVTK